MTGMKRKQRAASGIPVQLRSGISSQAHSTGKRTGIAENQNPGRKKELTRL